MSPERSPEQLEYESAHAQQEQEQEKPHYTPRPKSQVIMAWVLLGIVIFAILGMCYWQIFGIF